MQRNNNVYFVGKVLNRTEAPDDRAKSFVFTKTERASLAKQLRGIPVQMEHEDGLKVGEIKNAWRDANDQFWVYGQLSGKDLKSTFAKHAVQEKGSNKAYYAGLSLQHVHREWKDGSTEKAPIEVSLVVEPRRKNCDIVWVSNQKATNKSNYIGIVQAASSQQTSNMSAPTTEPAMENPVEAPAAEAEKEAAAPAAEAPTGLQLNEQVYSQMSELYEKDKTQAAELAKLREQLKEHQSQADMAQKSKLEEDAKKGRALMSTMLEHMRDLLGANEDIQQLEPQLMPLMQSNPMEMNQLLEVVAKASKKYKTQNMELKSAQNDLQEKDLELKFQKLIKAHGMTGMTATTEVASRKRAAPIAAPVAVKTQKTANPYLRTAGPRGGQKRGMNKDLLHAFMQNKSGGARQSMARLHNSLKETMDSRNMYPSRY
jgi:hypothetical protein